MLFLLAAFLKCGSHIFDVIRYLGNEYYVRAARNSRIEGNPADLVSHDFYNENTSVRRRRCVNTVNGAGCNVNRTVKAEGHIRSPQVVVDGLGERYHVKPLLGKQVGGFVRAVATEDNKAVELVLFICVLHCLYLVKSVFVRGTHFFERLSRGAEYSSAEGQYARKVGLLHFF